MLRTVVQLALRRPTSMRVLRRAMSTTAHLDVSQFDSRVFTEDLKFIEPEKAERIPTYRVIDTQGNVLKPEHDPNLDQETLVKVYKSMITLDTMDNILYDVQRQGRISFYMTNYGEAASHLGSAVALKPEDVIYGQYREAGVLLWRGFTLDHFMNQVYSNHLDLGKGRQMPVHYGGKDFNFHTISSPLATQIPQAAGMAYAQRYLHGQKDRLTACYFGDGAASEGDFHAALNFAATLECPTIFFVRNNGYAISTPIREQFRGDGIASRGSGYGMNTIRVDGNDFFAVYNVTKEARRIALEQGRPILIEAITYRVGHHSTSDDSTRYRESSEIERWVKSDNPIKRMRGYLENKGWWNQTMDEEFATDIRKEVLLALVRAEKRKKPSIEELFTDVYDTVPKHLQEQKQQLEAHLKQHSMHYPLIDYHK